MLGCPSGAVRPKSSVVSAEYLLSCGWTPRPPPGGVSQGIPKNSYPKHSHCWSQEGNSWTGAVLLLTAPTWVSVLGWTQPWDWSQLFLGWNWGPHVIAMFIISFRAHGGRKRFPALWFQHSRWLSCSSMGQGHRTVSEPEPFLSSVILHVWNPVWKLSDTSYFMFEIQAVSHWDSLFMTTVQNSGQADNTGPGETKALLIYRKPAYSALT